MIWSKLAIWLVENNDDDIQKIDYLFYFCDASVAWILDFALLLVNKANFACIISK